MIDINKLSDNEAVSCIEKLVMRLKEASYSRGYKDGFNDGKEAEHQRQMFLNGMDANKIRKCDRCGVVLSKDNNKCGYEICDRCNDLLDEEFEKDGFNDGKEAEYQRQMFLCEKEND